MISILLRSLLLTLAAELPLGALLSLRDRSGLRTVLLMNLATNPPAVFCLTLARKFWAAGPALAMFVVLECLVWAAETLLLRLGTGLEPRRAAMLSLVLNGASCALGVLVSL